MGEDRFTDGFGARRLLATADDQEELLVLRPELSGSGAFELAVRDRAARLQNWHHRGVARIRRVFRENGGPLTIACDVVAGARLSTLLDDPAVVPAVRAAAVTWIGQVLHSIADLHATDDDVVHGVLAAERVVITGQGDAIVTDYALGSAVGLLRYSPDRYWRDLRVAVPRSSIRFDAATDLLQVGSVALALFGRRALRDDEHPTDGRTLRIPLAESLVKDFGKPAADDLLRWVARALQWAPPFRSMSEALEEYDALLVRHSARWPARVPIALPSDSSDATVAAELPTPPERSAALIDPAPVAPSLPETVAAPLAARTRSVSPALSQLAVGPRAQRLLRSRAFLGSALATAGLVATTYAFAVASRPAAVLRPAAAPPARSTATLPVVEPPAAAPVPAPAASVKTTGRTDDAVEVAPAAGWIEIASPEPVEVREGDRLLAKGATERFKLAAGVHSLRLVNEATGVDVRRTVDVAGGKVTVLPVAIRRGMLAINATPWADVWVDGRQVGQTPLSNVPAPAGLHEVRFRHPSLGERRRMVTVPVSGIARLSVDLTKQ